MFTVAMIGPDGVGKTTVSRQLEKTLPMRAKYVYLGVNLDASNVALPSSRLIHSLQKLLGKQQAGGPRDPNEPVDQPKGIFKRVCRQAKRSLRLVNTLAEETYRQFVVRWHLFRGTVVVLDRDFFVDFYAYDIADDARPRSILQRIHGYYLKHLYRRPDLVICLDADAETMFARKGEGTVDLLNRRRRDYQSLRKAVAQFVVVDADRPLATVVADVKQHICRFPSNAQNSSSTATSSSLAS
jgi:thymidylate kinase